MNRNLLKYLLLWLLSAIAFPAGATPLPYVTQHNNQNTSTLISSNVFILTNKSGDLEIDSVLNKEFTRYNGEVLNLGFTKGRVWIKFDIKNNTKDSELYLKVAQPVIDSIRLFLLSEGRVKDSFALGEYNQFGKRFIKTPDYVFPVKIETGAMQTFLLELRSDDPIQMPLSIGSAKTVMQEEQIQSILFGIYAGIIIIMILYNAFISVTVKDRAYIYYVFFVLFVGLTQAVLKGYAFQYLWPSWPWLALHSTVIVPTLSGVTTGLFMKSFLNLKKSAPKFNFWVSVFIAVYILAGLTGLFYDLQTGMILLQIIAFSGSLFALSVGFWLMYKGLRIAVFFVIAYSIFLLAVIIFVLCNFNILPYNNFTAYILEIGSVLQIMLLSLALADKINTYRREQAIARREGLRVSKENERLVREQNILLEKEVKVRTAELESANDNLNQTLAQLKTAQAKLVDSEKMASLGQLTAGVAHEINNPINFVASNIKPLELDFKDVFNVLEKYQNIDASKNVETQLQEIEAYKQEIDLTYIGKEIQSLLEGIKEGANRTAEIVKNLKNFSRVDQSNIKFVDLNEGLESTLLLIRNTFPANLVVEKDLQALPKVECVPGRINQVFMNIITNAVHAIKAKTFDNKDVPKLTFNSWQEGNTVKILFKDNGIGMKEEVMQKVFDPFFTTKEVGEGIGLGMSIVKSIVDSHHATLEVNSIYGEGSEFILTLPLESA